MGDRKKYINNKYFKHLDIALISSVLMICIFSIINIFSTTHLMHQYTYVFKQGIWLVIGIIVIYLIINIDYRVLVQYAIPMYIINIILMLYTIIFGKEINGAKVWITFGPFGQIEPGEFLKITLTLLLAKKIEEVEGEINNFNNIGKLLILSSIPLLLLIKQSDLGITLVCCSIILGILFIGGLNWKVLSFGLVASFIFVVAAWNLNLVKDYQKVRITSFLNQSVDETGSGLQLKQSKIAIGAGGIIGQGYLQGKQVNKGAVPEQSTDFIFSVVGEEWGLLGSTILLILYGILIFRILAISRTAKDLLGSLFSIGIASELLFSVLQNIGMNIGIMPITGITLPFMSYGGSSILSNAIAFGIVLNIGMRKKKIEF